MPSPLGLLKNNDLVLRARSLFLRRPRGSGIIIYIKIIDSLYLLSFNLLAATLRRLTLSVYHSKYTWIGLGFGVSLSDGFRLKLLLCAHITSIFSSSFMWRCKSSTSIHSSIGAKSRCFFWSGFLGRQFSPSKPQPPSCLLSATT